MSFGICCESTSSLEKPFRDSARMLDKLCLASVTGGFFIRRHFKVPLKRGTERWQWRAHC